MQQNLEHGKSYLARCTGADGVTWGVSQNGNVQIGLEFELTQEPFTGRKIGWIGNFGSEKSQEIALNALEACGWEGDDPIASLEGIDKNEVSLAIELESDPTDPAKVYTRVKWVNRPGSGRIKFKQAASQGDLEAIRGSVRALILQRRQGAPKTNGAPRNGAATQRTVRKEGARPPDDDFGPEDYNEDLGF